MEFLQNILENSQLQLLSAFILGLMTAISPCPLATNITAVGFISKDIKSRSRVLFNGITYTAGRAVSYTSIGLLFFFGANQFKLSGFLQQWGEKLLSPLLIVIGLFMLGVFSFTIPGLSKLTDKVESQAKKGYWGALLLGLVFALAFCPYSGVLYFGMLIPMTIASPQGLLLPIVFALATGIPVIIFSWVIAFSINSVGKIYDRVKLFERWFRRIVAVVFIAVGIYYFITIYL
ncbi:cytochrome C biogenesis DsbD-like protein [Mangrovibacterium marinum]|uniref:Cytochrome C biogenesis DsbD-like protein n=1 Tax=Mangrovibacterium marinum TaxID=1639118 RepID=A0A2T5C1U7_9BACT|nr:aromatic aminobenezylarsenical efflux permease ArsG family transporter [Mangrovibacterium marinum]PTN08584.1 cytochrome C biogenesis DsbD-like protein [Mangrovibacterium marinum]